MTGTLHGLIIYRLQDEIKKNTGLSIPYQELSDSLINVLMEIDKEVPHNASIDLPSGNSFIKHDYMI